VAPVVGGIVWLLLFIAFVTLLWANPRKRAAGAPQRVPEGVVVGVGAAAFLVGVVSLVLLLRQLVPG
jgi:uncharacterized membrane protein